MFILGVSMKNSFKIVFIGLIFCFMHKLTGSDASRLPDFSEYSADILNSGEHPFARRIDSRFRLRTHIQSHRLFEQLQKQFDRVDTYFLAYKDVIQKTFASHETLLQEHQRLIDISIFELKKYTEQHQIDVDFSQKFIGQFQNQIEQLQVDINSLKLQTADFQAAIATVVLINTH